MDRRVLPIGFLVLLAAGGIVVHAPNVQAQTSCSASETFEDDTNFQPPTACWYTPSTMGTTVVNTLRPYEGTKSLNVPADGDPAFIVAGYAPCTDGIVTTTRWYENLDIMPNTVHRVGWTFNVLNSIYIEHTGGGALSLFNGIGGVPISGITITVDTWYGFELSAACNAGASNDDVWATVWLASDPAGTIRGAAQSDATLTSGYNGAGGALQIFNAVGGTAQSWVDNIQVEPYYDLPVITGTEVVVTDLTGGSMDAGGQNIIARLDNGETIATYGVGDLTQLATTSTPNCTGRQDGVNAALYGGESWITYVDCDGDGEADSFQIRNYALGTPTFPCEEATASVDNDAPQVDIPNDAGDIGTISDLNPSYADRCDDELVNKASVGWGFSTVGGAGIGGRIGVWAVTYNSGILGDEDDVDRRVLDSTSSPEIDGFCAWQNPVTGKDYIAGVASVGQTGVYEVISSVVRKSEAGLEFEPVVELEQRFLNSGTYGGGVGLACAQDSIVVSTVNNQVHLLDDITTSPAAAAGWPIAATVAEDGVAMSGSGTYIALVDGSDIEVYHRNGTLTARFEVPAGTFHNMEFDNSGEHLVVFTSTRIKVFDTAEATCALDDNCAELGNLEDEGGPLTDDDDDDPDTAGTGVFAVSEGSCEVFGSCRAAQGFQGIIALASGAGMGGVATVAAGTQLKARISLKVVLAAAGACGFLAVATGYFLGFIAEWFFLLMIVALIGFLVFLGIRAVGGGDE